MFIDGGMLRASDIVGDWGIARVMDDVGDIGMERFDEGTANTEDEGVDIDMGRPLVDCVDAASCNFLDIMEFR